MRKWQELELNFRLETYNGGYHRGEGEAVEQVELSIVVVVDRVDDTSDEGDVEEGGHEGEDENRSELTEEVRVEEAVGGVEYDGDDQDVQGRRLKVDLRPSEHPEEDGRDHDAGDDEATGLGDDVEDVLHDPVVIEVNTDQDGGQEREKNPHGLEETFIFLEQQRLGRLSSLIRVLHGVALDDVKEPRPFVSVSPAW